MSLDPISHDPYTYAVKPLFEANAGLGEKLRTEYQQLDLGSIKVFNKEQLKTALKDEFKSRLEQVFADEHGAVEFFDEVKRALQERLVAAGASELAFEQIKGFPATIEEVLLYSGSDLSDAKVQDFIEVIVNAIPDEKLEAGVFQTLKKEGFEEDLSLKTQFYFANANVFCKANGLSEANFANGLDKHHAEIADIVKNSLIEGQNVEYKLFEFINEHSEEFGLTSKLSEDQFTSIADSFKKRWTVAAGADHFDEFLMIGGNDGAFSVLQGSVADTVMISLKKALSYPDSLEAKKLSPDQQSFIASRPDLHPEGLVKKTFEFSEQDLLTMVERAEPKYLPVILNLSITTFEGKVALISEALPELSAVILDKFVDFYITNPTANSEVDKLFFKFAFQNRDAHNRDKIEKALIQRFKSQIEITNVPMNTLEEAKYFLDIAEQAESNELQANLLVKASELNDEGVMDLIFSRDEHVLKAWIDCLGSMTNYKVICEEALRHHKDEVAVHALAKMSSREMFENGLKNIKNPIIEKFMIEYFKNPIDLRELGAYNLRYVGQALRLAVLAENYDLAWEAFYGACYYGSWRNRNLSSVELVSGIPDEKYKDFALKVIESVEVPVPEKEERLYYYMITALLSGAIKTNAIEVGERIIEKNLLPKEKWPSELKEAFEQMRAQKSAQQYDVSPSSSQHFTPDTSPSARQGSPTRNRRGSEGATGPSMNQ